MKSDIGIGEKTPHQHKDRFYTIWWDFRLLFIIGGFFGGSTSLYSTQLFPLFAYLCIGIAYHFLPILTLLFKHSRKFEGVRKMVLENSYYIPSIGVSLHKI